MLSLFIGRRRARHARQFHSAAIGYLRRATGQGKPCPFKKDPTFHNLATVSHAGPAESLPMVDFPQTYGICPIVLHLGRSIFSSLAQVDAGDLA